jgi:hypothetical protein
MKIRIGFQIGPTEESDPEDRDGAFAYNTVSPYLAVRAALHSIAETRSPQIAKHGDIHLTIQALDEEGNLVAIPEGEEV